jgi:mono/diheme cytochrome c family protein
LRQVAKSKARGQIVYRGKDMTLNRVKVFVAVSFVLPVLAFSVFFRTTTAAVVTRAPEDVAAVYKAKCAMCHSPKAEKAYDPAMPQEEQILAVLKGKKAEKPPNMPAFEPKGMTADEAKALVEYMQALRKSAQ